MGRDLEHKGTPKNQNVPMEGRTQHHSVWFGLQSQCTPTNQNVRSVDNGYNKCTGSVKKQAERKRTRIEVELASLCGQYGKLGTTTGNSFSDQGPYRKNPGGSATVIQANSSLSVEAQALREAVVLVENLNIQRAIIETYSLQIVQTLKSGVTIWEIDPIIQDIISIQKRLSNYGFTWTPREGNRLAHSLAALKLKNQLLAIWPTTPPPQIAEIIRRE
ncbi:hypothetical protein AHAS_Ahas16G0233200 [Arachis hypogaea]